MLVGEVSRWGNRRDEVDALLPAADARSSGSPNTATRTATATSSTSARATAACRTRVGRTPGTRCASRDGALAAAADRAVRGAGLRVRRADRARRTARPRPATSSSRASLRSACRRAEAAVQRGLLGRRPTTAATSRWDSIATSARSTASAPTWAIACGPASSTRRRHPPSRARCVGPGMLSGWGIRTLSEDVRGLQPDLVPLRERLAARQRDLRGRPHALRLRRGSAPRDARTRRGIARGSATCSPSCSPAWPAARSGFPVPLSHVVLAAGVGGRVAVAVPPHDAAVRARLPEREAAPRAGGARVDRTLRLERVPVMGGHLTLEVEGDVVHAARGPRGPGVGVRAARGDVLASVSVDHRRAASGTRRRA